MTRLSSQGDFAGPAKSGIQQTAGAQGLNAFQRREAARRLAIEACAHALNQFPAKRRAELPGYDVDILAGWAERVIEGCGYTVGPGDAMAVSDLAALASVTVIVPLPASDG